MLWPTVGELNSEKPASKRGGLRCGEDAVQQDQVATDDNTSVHFKVQGRPDLNVLHRRKLLVR